MSWQVYGAMLPFGTSKQFGPLPKKRWVNRSGERYRVKRSRPSHHSAETPTDYNAAHAITYARWLAARDGAPIDVERGGCVVYATFRSAISGKTVKRIEAVRFGARYVGIPNWDFEPREPHEEFEHVASLSLPPLPY